MSSFSRFQQKQRAFLKSEQQLNTQFIYNGYPSIVITNDLSSEKIQAVVVNKQEREEAYIYTPLDQPLLIGSTWQAKSLHLLVAEEIVVIKDVNWHKYYCYLCNLENNGMWWFFYSNKKRAINLALRQNIVLESTQKPVLVTGGQPLKIEDKITAGGRAWLVNEYDNLSTAGLTYYTLTETTMSKDALEEGDEQQLIIEPKDDTQLIDLSGPVDGKTYVLPQQEVTIGTEGGFYEFSDKTVVKLIKRTSTSITFAVDYNVSAVTITIKNNGENVPTVYTTERS